MKKENDCHVSKRGKNKIRIYRYFTLQQMGTHCSPFLGIHIVLGRNKQTLKLLKLQTMKIETKMHCSEK